MHESRARHRHAACRTSDVRTGKRERLPQTVPGTGKWAVCYDVHSVYSGDVLPACLQQFIALRAAVRAALACLTDRGIPVRIELWPLNRPALSVVVCEFFPSDILPPKEAAA